MSANISSTVWDGLTSLRLHGSPRIHWSACDGVAIENHARFVEGWAARGAEVGAIYDDTAADAASMH